jgi:hypothetical protein
MFNFWGRKPEEMLALFFLAMPWIIISWRLWRAYRDYLGMDHAIGIVISVQIILFLFSMVMLQSYYNALR